MSEQRLVVALIVEIVSLVLAYAIPASILRIAHKAPTHVRTLVHTVLGGFVLLAGTALALSIAGFVRLPILVVTVYSLAVPVAFVAIVQRLVSSLDVLLFPPFQVGEWAQIDYQGAVSSGTVLDITMHDAFLLSTDKTQVIRVPNSVVSNAIVTRPAHAIPPGLSQGTAKIP